MSSIIFKPKQKQHVVIVKDELELDIKPPIADITPIILELQKFNLTDVSSVDPKFYSLAIKLIETTIRYNYPELTDDEIKTMMQDYCKELISNIGYFLGQTEEEIAESKRKYKMIAENSKLKNL